MISLTEVSAVPRHGLAPPLRRDQDGVGDVYLIDNAITVVLYAVEFQGKSHTALDWGSIGAVLSRCILYVVGGTNSLLGRSAANTDTVQPRRGRAGPTDHFGHRAHRPKD